MTASCKKVLFVTPSAYVLSGLAIWLDNLIPGLQQRGWLVRLGLVAGPRYHQPDRYLQAHPSSTWTTIRCDSGTAAGRRASVASVISRVMPDLVVSVNIPDALVAAAELRSRGLTQSRIVMTCHGIQRDLFDDMRSLPGCLDAVVCVNRLACRLAEAFAGYPPERVFYAECGTSLPPLPNPQSSHSPLRIVYVGRLEQPEKRVFDLPLILDDLDRLSIPHHLTIAGDGPEQDGLRRCLASRIATGTVRMLGYVAASELSETAYANADLLLVTSTRETGPLVIWEAMVRGIPVVSSRYVGSGLQAFLKHEENCLLFDVGDTVEAARQIARLAVDQSLRSRIRENGLSAVRARLTTERSIAQWDDVFHRILELPPVPFQHPLRKPDEKGRLERWFGSAFAEWLRSRLGRKGPDAGPSGEWPHTWTGTDNDAAEFWTLARHLDRGTAPDNDEVRQLIDRLCGGSRVGCVD